MQINLNVVSKIPVSSSKSPGLQMEGFPETKPPLGPSTGPALPLPWPCCHPCSPAPSSLWSSANYSHWAVWRPHTWTDRQGEEGSQPVACGRIACWLVEPGAWEGKGQQ